VTSSGELLTTFSILKQHRNREEHSMFHANLKMTHGLMSRVKTVIEAYKEVLAKGHISAKMAEDARAAKFGNGPTVVRTSLEATPISGEQHPIMHQSI